MKHIAVASMVVLAVVAIAPAGRAADPDRQQAVRERSADVMPFDMAATTHVFTKTPTGGVQRVVAKSAADVRQIALVRVHLKDIATRFGRGNFAAPSHVHGEAMPGLAALRNAAAGDLRVRYHELRSGAEIRYSSANPATVDALHRWFDAQLADHGPDAVAGPGRHLHQDH